MTTLLETGKEMLQNQVRVLESNNFEHLTRISILEEQLNKVLTRIDTLISKNDYLEEKLNELEKRPLIAKFE